MSLNERISQLQKDRAKQKAALDEQMKQLQSEASKDRTAASRFTARTDGFEEHLKLDTVGLHQLEEFLEKKRAIEEQRQREAARTDELKAQETKKKRAKKDKKAKLSFAVDDQEDDDPPPAKKLKKNPTVDTSFLPDREREEEDRRMREELRQKYLRDQEAIKQEPITVVFSYWDGHAHRSDVECKKGDTIATFLEKARQCFPELKKVSVDNLLYVKEDLIIPHVRRVAFIARLSDVLQTQQHYTFYDFIVSKARGKSGPLFHFDAHEDVRLLADATVEKDESHAGKVVERAWYQRFAHIFPQSRWEQYVPEKDYGAYRLRG